MEFSSDIFFCESCGSSGSRKELRQGYNLIFIRSGDEALAALSKISSVIENETHARVAFQRGGTIIYPCAFPYLE